jgi:integrase
LTKVSQLYRYAGKHGWCPENLVARLTRPQTRAGIPHHLSVEQAARLLTQAAEHNLVAFVALGLFAGIRPDEIRRLTWDKVKFENRVVILDQTATKTGQHRVVELHPTALAWLKTCRKSSGRIVDLPEITFKRQWKALRHAAGFKQWSNDDMRHTAATYSCALTGDYAKVAAELGHDVRVLHRHYRGLATKPEAERFYKLTPAKVSKGKIVTMPAPTEQVAEQVQEQAIKQVKTAANG